MKFYVISSERIFALVLLDKIDYKHFGVMV
jgi:hypothetical protein